MNIKRLVLAACAAAMLTLSSLASAGGFQVTQIYASGNMFFVDYQKGYVENPDHDTFSIVYDKAAELVNFDFSSTYRDADTGEVLAHYDYHCSVGPESRNAVGAYFFDRAVELAENLDMMDFFIVRTLGPKDCVDVSDLEYREDLVRVAFYCEEGYTYWGQSVYVVGSSEQLGHWDPAKAVKLEPEYYPLWSKGLAVEKDSTIEWKCIKRDELDATAGIAWEPGSNQSFNSGYEAHQWGRF